MEEDEVVTPDSARAEAIEDQPESKTEVDPKAGELVSYVTGRFHKARDKRRFDEYRWITAYKNYRGIYGSDVQFTDTEKSRVFIKVTKTKVLAAYGQLIEVLFGKGDFPISIEPTQMPEGVSDAVHFDVQNVPEPTAPNGLPELKPGDTMQTLLERTGPLKDKLAPVEDKLKEGEGTTPSAITFHPAKVAAKRMEKTIHDQLTEAGANKQLRSAAFECAQFGTGIIKGPFAIDKEYPKWNEAGDYEPIVKLIPSTSYVSIWNFYPDPDGNNMEDVEYVIERHKMSRSKLRQLKNRPYFRSNAIDRAISYGEDYTEEDWEHQVEDSAENPVNERFEVLEYWGHVDVKQLQDLNVSIPKASRKLEQVSINAWVCNNQLLRLVINPYKPSYLPYHAFPYEVNPYSFFGVGVAENMNDTQDLMNGFMRMAVDNAALSGNVILEVDETMLVPGQSYDLYPGKQFRREGGQPGQSIHSIDIKNTSNENMQLFDKARVLADESTGLPSYAYGQTGIQGTGRTASGISMLMSAAHGSIRTVVKNVDDYLLNPLGKYFYYFNMQFSDDPDIKGDLEVKARGTESLMASEVRSQRLMQFLSIAMNPATAPFAKLDYLLREIAKSLDLDPDKTTNNLSDAALQAEILKKVMPQQELPPPQEGQEGAPANPSVADTQGTGNANVAIGGVNTPGEQGFTGNV